MSRFLCGAAGLSLVAAVSPAKAQQTTLEEVVVTAQKREASLQDVAAAISALGSDALRMRGVSDVESLTTQIPNVAWGEQSSSSLVTIRGIGTSVDTGVAEPNVGIHIDGVYQSRGTMATLELQDIGRVEVLRGPQGTLYGRNSTGGAINIVSAQPTHEFSAEAAASFGNYGGYGARGFVSGPISMIADARLSAFYKHSNGYYENISNGDKKADEVTAKGVRGSVKIDPGNILTADLSAYYQIHDSGKYVAQQLLTPVPPFFAALGGSAAGVQAATSTTRPRKVASDIAGGNRIETLGLTASLTWTLTPDLSLKSTTGYVDHKLSQSYDGDATNYNQSVIGKVAGVADSKPRIGDAKTFSQEFNLSGIVGTRFNWLGGLFFFHEDFSPDLAATLANGLPQAMAPPGGLPPGSIIVQRGEETTRSYAAFADATLRLTDRMRISGGVRVGRDQKKFVQTAGLSIPGAPLSSTLACSNLVHERTFRSTTPRVALEYDATKDALVYVQYAKGYRSGGFNNSDCTNDFGPEEVDAFETGLKLKFAEHRGTLNVSVFDYDYSGLQIFQLNGFLQNIANANAKVRGAEAELTFAPVQRVQINAALSYLDAKYADFLNTDPMNPLAGPQQLRGNRINRAPKYTLSAGVQYSVAAADLGLGLGGDFRMRAEVFHSAKVFYRPFNIDQDRQAPFTVANLFLEYRGAKGRTLRGYVKNLGDVNYLANVVANPTEGAWVGKYNAPRTFGIEIAQRF